MRAGSLFSSQAQRRNNNREPDTRNHTLSDADVRLLALSEHGHTYTPKDAAEGVFDLLIDHLRQLRDRGLLRLDEGCVMKSERGGYLMAGPCDLTDGWGRGATHEPRVQ